MGAQRSLAKEKKTIKFTHRESYEVGELATKGNLTEIASGSSGSPPSGAAVVISSLTEANVGAFAGGDGGRGSGKRCSVISTPGAIVNDTKRASIMSTMSEWWEDDTIDEEQVKAAQKLANKLAARRGGAVSAPKKAG